MKKLFFLPLIAVLLLPLCQNKLFAQTTDDKIYNFVSIENPPTYPGGMAKFYEFLGQNIKYPDLAKSQNVQGNVFVSFVVEKDGSLIDIKVDRKLGAGTDEEAIRVLKLAKRWNPGLLNGKPVRVKYNLPIKFAIPGRPKSPEPIDKNKVGAIPSETDTTVYSFVSVSNPPKYPGGTAKFLDFVMDNLKYPAAAKENNIEGIVFLSFIVEKDGSITSINVDRKLGYGTDEEAVRVVKLAKRWEPATYNGITIRTQYRIPIRFSLNKSTPKTN